MKEAWTTPVVVPMEIGYEKSVMENSLETTSMCIHNEKREK